MSPVSRDEIAAWSAYVYEITGIHLDESKGYLIETRMAGLMRELGAASLAELLRKVKGDVSNVLRGKIIDAITTNETSFFRDTSPFELLQHKIIPDLIDQRRKTLGNITPLPIRIWSAACSTGQEIYSTGIVLKELLGDLSKYDIRILGTDISSQAVAQASYGCYSKMELDRGMPPDKITRYFTVDPKGHKIRDDIRALATFRQLNLLGPLAFPHKFDIVMCRNVAIYFTEKDKIRLFKGIERVLAPDGYLMIGSTETITGLCPEFEAKRYLRAVYYQFKGNG
jgi:chemotaxis protein methyltransferase CheR